MATAEGNESIVHVLDRKESLLEADILNDTACSINAQAVDRIKLLSIPAPVMRAFLASDKTLALNMLTMMAQRSQRLITQFEQLTLRSATERVGWFLLHVRLASDPNSMQITLPFNKSLVAAYLGIKPETFSRILQTLRDDGFTIHQRRITMPDPHALCKFCTVDEAARCPRINTPQCPRRDLCHKPAAAKRA